MNEVEKHSRMWARSDPSGWLAGWHAWCKFWSRNQLGEITYVFKVGQSSPAVRAEDRKAARAAFDDATFCNQEDVFGKRPQIIDGVERLLEFLNG